MVSELLAREEIVECNGEVGQMLIGNEAEEVGMGVGKTEIEK